MDFIDIAKESIKIYKKNFSDFALPFLALALLILVSFSLMSFKNISKNYEDETKVNYGENLNSSFFVDSNDENYFKTKTNSSIEKQRIEVEHISESFSDKKDGRFLRVSLNFKSKHPASYRFDIYNYSNRSWEKGKVENVENREKDWTIKRTEINSYLGRDNLIRVRIISENSETVLKEDYLTYDIIGMPDLGTISLNLGILTFVVIGLAVCSGIVIVGTWRKTEKDLKFKDILKRIGRNLHHILIISLPFYFLLVGSQLLFLSLLKGIAIMLFGFFLLFLSLYAWPGIIIESKSVIKGIKKSLDINRRNIGTTLIFWFILAFSWLLSSMIPIFGIALFWIFLPFWIVMVTVSYIDEIEENQKK